MKPPSKIIIKFHHYICIYHSLRLYHRLTAHPPSLHIQLEDMELTVADMVQRVMKANFANAWEEIGEKNELENTFALPMNTLEGDIT